jgi:hypothetical protein
LLPELIDPAEVLVKRYRGKKLSAILAISHIVSADACPMRLKTTIAAESQSFLRAI